MTPSNSIAVDIFSRPVRALSFILRAVWAVIVLLSVFLLWLVLFLLFLPFLIVSELMGWKTKLGSVEERATESAGFTAALNPPPLAGEASSDTAMIFDRRHDVSKLFGCNTRSVQYRWSLFARRLAETRARFQKPRALDFGAGSLRDSYELSRLGFEVVSVDLDREVLENYAKAYDWTLVTRPSLFTDPFEDLEKQNRAGHFHIALSFDVIEHLEDPGGYLRQLHPLLDEQGFLFAIVPNRFSLFERHFKRSLRKQRRKGVTLQRGVPHLQFKSPAEWKAFFEAQGFRVVEHDMTLGFFVNDCWNGLLTLPIRVYVEPVFSHLASRLGLRFNAETFEKLFVPPWLMERVHVLDLLLKRRLRDRYGWNLIIAQKNLSEEPAS